MPTCASSSLRRRRHRTRYSEWWASSPSNRRLYQLALVPLQDRVAEHDRDPAVLALLARAVVRYLDDPQALPAPRTGLVTAEFLFLGDGRGALHARRLAPLENGPAL